MWDTIKSSIAASLLLAVAIPVLLQNSLLGAILLTLGFYAIGYFKLLLYPGEVGYLFTRDSRAGLLGILLVNLTFGYLFGLCLSLHNPVLISLALIETLTVSFSIEHFIGAVLCGVLMFVAIDMYRGKDKIAVFLCVPVFILAGFHHCIVDSIVMGIARSFNAVIFLTVLGNTIGAVLAWFLFQAPKLRIRNFISG